MESFGGFGFSDLSRTVRKKRSNSSRRPRNDSQLLPDYRDTSSLSSTPPSENASKASSDENMGHGTNYRMKELNLNQCSSRASPINLNEAETSLKRKNEIGGFGESCEARVMDSSEQRHSGIHSKMYSEGVLSTANWKSSSKVMESLQSKPRTRDTQISGSQCFKQSEAVTDVLGNDNKLKKVKLKVGGVIRTIHPTSTTDGASVGGSSSTLSSRSSDAPRPRKKLILQDNSDEDHSPSQDKGNGPQGVQWKDFSRSDFNVKKTDSSRAKMSKESVSLKQSEKYEPVRKSKRVPKRRLLDGGFDDGDDDDDEEIRYLEKLKTSKVASDYGAEFEDEDEAGSRKQRKISRVMKRNVGGYNVNAIDYGSKRSGKEGKMSRSGRTNEDTDYLEDEEPVSDGEPEIKRKKQRKEFVDVSGDSKKEMAVTTRQRALQSGKDISFNSGTSLIEFPNGLPPAPPRKQKEILSEVDQQLKKAEAAQRRKMQVEKAARESEAEAIRKILGQDSSRKKREDKIKKRQEELAQERAANAMTFTSNTVRWVMGPSGTVVTFPIELGLPSIFDPKPCSYPPPREKCAGPSCTNPYKYRDSKSKLPLCSLQCYKAIHENIQPLTAC
ncbi:uncharacterized protein LOC132294540 [Cornus florida]|uniref:uncharacterized protein LOC132294540 n=1 Tax=Cornus florida TaxID=4283 RepID=UPI00289F0CD1|nr:uncharacterized protein LOC132294540 [Cornus florida]